MRNALFIALNDTRFMLREKATLLWLFVMPVVFFYFIGTVTSGFGGPSGNSTGPTLLHLEGPASGGATLNLLLQRIEESGFQLTREPPSGRNTGTLTIPDDFEDRLNRQEPVVLVYESGSQALQGDYDLFRLQRTVYSLLAEIVVLELEGGLSLEGLQSFPERKRAVALDVSTAAENRKIPTGFQQAVPGILVMFTLLVVLTSGATLLIIEREKGLLRRLASAPISRAQLVFGKWLGRMVLALIQITFAMITGSLLFSMDWGPDLGMILVVLMAWAAFCASFGLLLGCLARTQGQAVGLGVLTANLLGALGGCWWPIEITPGWMQSLQRLIPSGWAMHALHQLVSFQAGWTAATSSILLLALGSVLLGILATRVFRYQ